MPTVLMKLVLHHFAVTWECLEPSKYKQTACDSCNTSTIPLRIFSSRPRPSDSTRRSAASSSSRRPVISRTVITGSEMSCRNTKSHLKMSYRNTKSHLEMSCRNTKSHSEMSYRNTKSHSEMSCKNTKSHS